MDDKTLQQTREQTPEEYFAEIQRAADATKVPEVKQREFTDLDERQMQDGFAIEEMTKTAGWAIVKEILEATQNHAWVNPVGLKKEEWEFAEMNAFHRANNARELLESLNQMIIDAHELHRVKVGEIKPVERMRV